jgi:hypothetical protein
MALHPAWHPPLGYKDGEYGAEKVPSGAYPGNRDMFPFLVDSNRDLDDPTDSTHAGLFRGFIPRNSDVGAAALTHDVFLFRQICGNQLIWGFQLVAGFRRRHIGASIQAAWTSSLEGIRAALDADPASERAVLLRASSQGLGLSRDAVVDTVMQRLDLSRKRLHSGCLRARYRTTIGALSRASASTRPEEPDGASTSIKVASVGARSFNATCVGYVPSLTRRPIRMNGM